MASQNRCFHSFHKDSGVGLCKQMFDSQKQVNVRTVFYDHQYLLKGLYHT